MMKKSFHASTTLDCNSTNQTSTSLVTENLTSEKNINSILPTAGGKVENAHNRRQIDAGGKAEGTKPVIYDILYYRRRCPGRN